MDMGFEWRMIVELLRFENERVSGDTDWAINLLFKNDAGNFTHKFVSENNDNSFDSSSDLERRLSEDICKICWEPAYTHQDM